MGQVSPNRHKRIQDLDIKKLKHVKKIRADYVRSSQKIRIIRINPVRKFKVGGLILVLVILALALIFFNSETFVILKIANSLRGKNTLIGFQNSAELRPTGGFWGSFATLSVDKKIIKPQINFNIETNVYRNDNQLVAMDLDNAPKPVRETFINRPQTFVNANWDTDFPEAAKTLSWYFGQGWEKPIDNVIAISSTTVIDLLKITGPITLSDGTEINCDNFSSIMSQKIDQDYWFNEKNKVENEPKKILLEILPKLTEKFKGIGKFKLFSKTFLYLNEKNVIIYSSDTKIQSLIEKRGWGGNIPQWGNDFLYVINANLNGGKSSLNIDQVLNLNVRQKGKDLESELTIVRTHNPNPLGPDILNRNYTRVLVPMDAKIESVKLAGEGIYPDNCDEAIESGKKSIGFWFSTGFGKESSVKIQYQLPSNITKKNYKLIIMRQPGTNFDSLHLDLFGKKQIDTQLIKDLSF